MKVLVVVDQSPALDAISATLRREGHAVITAFDLAGALRRAAAEHPAAIVLAAPLGGDGGEDLCRLLRDGTGVPVLLLDPSPVAPAPVGAAVSERADRSIDRVGLSELPDRVAALTSPHRPKRKLRVTHHLGRLEVDAGRREARIAGAPLPLRAKEFDLLLAFVEHASVALSRDQLLHLVWGYTIPGTTRTVDVHVKNLRQRLPGAGVHIKTI